MDDRGIAELKMLGCCMDGVTSRYLHGILVVACLLNVRSPCISTQRRMGQ